MNFRDEAHAIVEQQNNEKWGETRAKIEAKLGEAYRLGFLDGEASREASEDHAEDRGCVCGMGEQAHSCA